MPAGFRGPLRLQAVFDSLDEALDWVSSFPPPKQASCSEALGGGYWTHGGVRVLAASGKEDETRIPFAGPPRKVPGLLNLDPGEPSLLSAQVLQEGPVPFSLGRALLTVQEAMLLVFEIVDQGADPAMGGAESLRS